MKKMPSDFIIVAVAAIIIVVIIGYMIYDGQDILGLTASDLDNLVMLAPSAIAVVFGGFAISRAEGNKIYTFAAVACFGFAFAFGIYSLNNLNILIPDLAMEIEDLIVLILFIFMLLAGLLMWRSRR